MKKSHRTSRAVFCFCCDARSMQATFAELTNANVWNSLIPIIEERVSYSSPISTTNYKIEDKNDQGFGSIRSNTIPQPSSFPFHRHELFLSESLWSQRKNNLSLTCVLVPRCTNQACVWAKILQCHFLFFCPL